MADNTKPFIAIHRQYFNNKQDWVNLSHRYLTNHEKFDENSFRAMCFDQKFRHLRIGADFDLAEKEGAFPVFWIWPDQWDAIFNQCIFQHKLIMALANELANENANFSLKDFTKALRDQESEGV